MGHSDTRPGRAGEDNARGNSPQSDLFRSDDGKDDSRLSVEQAAVGLHTSNRRRADLFSHPVMADKVMDIMLTALIAHEQRTALTRMAAAMANRLGLGEAERIMDDLIFARLLERRDGDGIGLTPLGADLMRAYVRRSR